MESRSGFTPVEQRRIEIAARVRATDSIPKVEGAGSIRTHQGVEAQVMHNGVLVVRDGYYGAWMTELISRLSGHHEPQEELAFHALVERLKLDTERPVMVELGAYWAYYSMWLTSAIPRTAAVLVEPDPANLKVGLRNIALNGMSATTIQAAIGASHGARVRHLCESDGVVRELPTVTVDGLMADHGLSRIDVLLCDAQGAEVEMLQGAAHAIRDGKVRFAVVSTHWFPDRPLIHQQCLALVRAFGGHIVADHSISESCSADGLIVASFDPRDREITVAIPVVRARDSEIGELEWHLAKRVGWRGVARGLFELVPGHLRLRFATTRYGVWLRQWVASRLDGDSR